MDVSMVVLVRGKPMVGRWLKPGCAGCLKVVLCLVQVAGMHSARLLLQVLVQGCIGVCLPY